MLQRLTSIYIMLLLTVFLLAFPLDGGYGVIMEFKHGLYMVICGGYVLIITMLRIMYAVTGTHRCDSDTSCMERIRIQLKHTPISVKLMLAFMFFTVVSAVFSSYPGAFRGSFRQEGALTISIYVLSAVFISAYFRPQKWMLFLLGAVMVPFCILALVQLTGANPFLLYPYGHNYYGSGIYYTGEFLSTLGNTAFVAAFICLAAGVLAMAIVKLELRERWFLSIPFFLAVLLVFKMSVYAALVALLAGFVFMLPVAITSRRTLTNTMVVLAIMLTAFFLSRILFFTDGTVIPAPMRPIFIAAVGTTLLSAVLISRLDIFTKITARQYRVGTAAVILGSVCFTLVYLWFYTGESGGMVYQISQILRGRWEDGFGSNRVFIWRNVLERITWRNLLLGTGPDTLGYWDIPYFYRVDDAGRTFVTNIDAAHNEFLHIFATGGLLSLLAYLGVIITVTVNWYRFPKNKLSAIAGAGVLFYLIQSFFGISQFISAPFFWGCLGVLVTGHTDANPYD